MRRETNRPRSRSRRADGYILMPVVIMLAVLASVSYMLSLEGAMGSSGSKRRLDMIQADFAAEAGLGAARWQLAQSTTCTGYSDILPTPFGSGYYSANVVPTTDSPVTLSATGTTASGAEHALIRTNVKVYQGPLTSNLQLGTDPGKDTFLYEWHPTWNYGGDTQLRVDEAAGASAHSLLDFDLSNLQQGIKIHKATLELHQSGPATAGGTISVHRLTRTWKHGKQTGAAGAASWNLRRPSEAWSSAGGDYDVTPVATATIAPATVGWYAWEIAPLVQDWVDGRYPNRGLALIPGVGTETRFDSSDSADSTFHPKLSLTYACECGVGGDAASLVVRPGPEGKDAAIVASSPNDNRGADGVATLESGTQVLLSEFYLLGIPPGSIVTSATLEFYHEGFASLGLPGNATVHRVTRDWLEGSGTLSTPTTDGATWNDYDGLNPWSTTGGDYDATPVATSFVDGTVGYVSWDVTSLVADWVSGAQPNYGLLTRSAGLLHEAVFSTSDNPELDQRPRLSISYTCVCGVECEDALGVVSSLLVSSLDDVTTSGVPGLDYWSDGTALVIAEPNLTLEPGTTDGTFSSLIDLDAFAADSNVQIDALHHVSSNLTVGGDNSLDLFAGDLLISTAENETLASENTMTVNNEDVFVFRPEVLGDYSAGSFIFLIDGSQIHSEADTVAISLVERDTTVGAEDLDKGSFLLGTSNSRDVYSFPADDVGLGTTSGPLNQLVDGLESSFGSELGGIDLAEAAIDLGGQTIPEGAIVLTLKDDDLGGVGANSLPVDGADLFYLAVTGEGEFGEADATLLFEGLDVNLDTSGEHLEALSFSNAETVVGGGTMPIAHWKFDEGTGSVAMDSVGGNDATLTGDPVWVTGQIGDALDFDGSGDAVVTDAPFTPPPIGTVTLWMKVSGPPASRGRILGMADDWEIRHESTGSPDVVPYGLSFDLGAGGTNEGFYTTTPIQDAGHWYFIAASYDTTTDAYAVYVDGALQKSGFYPSALSVPGAGLLGLGRRTGTGDFFDGELDDVRVYDRVLTPAEVSDLFVDGGGSGGGDAVYVQKYEPWSASVDAAWETFDLGVFGVPPNAVAEVAITNNANGAQRSAGVRALGSGLQRRVRLHESEQGGGDTVTMHVQTDDSSQIQHAAQRRLNIEFTLLGYWTVGTYVEAFDTFQAGGNNAWLPHDFAAHGVGPNQIVEVMIVNKDPNNERIVGMRRTGSTFDRRIFLHEAEAGGVDAITAMLETDGSAMAEVYASSDAQIDFHVVGYWSTPPGTYTEAPVTSLQATAAATWEAADLSAVGVPGHTVAQFLILNDVENAESEMGIRETGSTSDRLLDLHEAEGGGLECATMHVNVDENSEIELYSEGGTAERYFTPAGWWVTSP